MIHRKLLLTLGLGCHSLLAMAQSPSVHETQHPDHELQDVVVVGSRMPEIKQRAAASITIIPERDIREMSQILPDMQAIVGYSSWSASYGQQCERALQHPAWA